MKHKNLLQTTAILLLLSLSLENFSWASQEVAPLFLSRPKVSLGFDLPLSVATIEDGYQASDSSKTIYLIQDAHTNTSGQINLAKTLDLLLQKHPKLPIFTEGAIGDNSLSFLRQFKPLSQRKQIAGKYLHQGILHGAEYLDLTSDHPFTIWGVEDPELYLKALENYKTVARQRIKFQDYLNRIEQTVKVLKSRIYNPLLLSLDESNAQYQRGSLSITQYLKKLTSNQDLKDYPHLKNLKKLQRLEQVLEQQKKNYPKLSTLNHYKKLSSNLQAKQVLKELEDLESQAFDSLLTTQDEQQLFQASKTVDYFKKLLNLTLTPEEFKEHPSLTSLTGFLNKKIMDLKTYYENALFLEEGFEDVLNASEEFYDLTLKRDQKFIENMLGVWNAGSAALITGGYHTPNLKKLLKEKGISYAVLTPTITHETNQKRYERILLSQNIPNKLSFLNPPSFSAAKSGTLMHFYLRGMVNDPKARECLRELGYGAERGLGARLAKEEPGQEEEDWADFEDFSNNLPRKMKKIGQGGMSVVYGYRAKIGAQERDLALIFPKYLKELLRQGFGVFYFVLFLKDKGIIEFAEILARFLVQIEILEFINRVPSKGLPRVWYSHYSDGVKQIIQDILEERTLDEDLFSRLKKELKKNKLLLIEEMFPPKSISLQKRLNKPSRYPLTSRQKLLIFWSLAGTIRDLHRQKVLHRDINPNNIQLQKLEGDWDLEEIQQRPPIIFDFSSSTKLDYTPPDFKAGSMVGFLDQYDLKERAYYSTPGYGPGYIPWWLAQDGATSSEELSKFREYYTDPKLDLYDLGLTMAPLFGIDLIKISQTTASTSIAAKEKQNKINDSIDASVKEDPSEIAGEVRRILKSLIQVDLSKLNKTSGDLVRDLKRLIRRTNPSTPLSETPGIEGARLSSEYQVALKEKIVEFTRDGIYNRKTKRPLDSEHLKLFSPKKSKIGSDYDFDIIAEGQRIFFGSWDEGGVRHFVRSEILPELAADRSRKVYVTAKFFKDLGEWLLRTSFKTKTGTSKVVYHRFLGNPGITEHLKRVDPGLERPRKQLIDFVRKGVYSDRSRPPFKSNSLKVKTKGREVYLGGWEGCKIATKILALPKGKATILTVRRFFHEGIGQWALNIQFRKGGTLYQRYYRFKDERRKGRSLIEEMNFDISTKDLREKEIRKEISAFVENGVFNDPKKPPFKEAHFEKTTKGPHVLFGSFTDPRRKRHHVEAEMVQLPKGKKTVLKISSYFAENPGWVLVAEFNLGRKSFKSTYEFSKSGKYLKKADLDLPEDQKNARAVKKHMFEFWRGGIYDDPQKPPFSRNDGILFQAQGRGLQFFQSKSDGKTYRAVIKIPVSNHKDERAVKISRLFDPRIKQWVIRSEFTNQKGEAERRDYRFKNKKEIDRTQSDYLESGGAPRKIFWVLQELKTNRRKLSKDENPMGARLASGSLGGPGGGGSNRRQGPEGKDEGAKEEPALSSLIDLAPTCLVTGVVTAALAGACYLAVSFVGAIARISWDDAVSVFWRTVFDMALFYLIFYGLSKLEPPNSHEKMFLKNPEDPKWGSGGARLASGDGEKSETKKWESTGRIKILAEKEAGGLILEASKKLFGESGFNSMNYGAFWVEEREYSIELYSPKSSSSPLTLVRIGPLVFVVIDEWRLKENYQGLDFDEVAAIRSLIDRSKDQLGDLYAENFANIFFCNPSSYLDRLSISQESPLISPYAVSMMIAMLNERAHFRSAVALDMGAGDGILSRIAIGLGAKHVFLFEKKEPQAVPLDFYLKDQGWKEKIDYTIFFGDFTSSIFFKKNKKKEAFEKASVAIINIGPWHFYGDANRTAVKLSSQLPNLSLILNGGYYFSEGSHKSEFYYLKNYIKDLHPDSFEVIQEFSTDSKEDAMIGVLIARRLGARMAEVLDAKKLYSFSFGREKYDFLSLGTAGDPFLRGIYSLGSFVFGVLNPPTRDFRLGGLRISIYDPASLKKIVGVLRKKYAGVFKNFSFVLPNHDVPGQIFNLHSAGTAVMMMRLAQYFPGAQVIDVGAGRGFLSLVAFLLGAGKVFLLEKDRSDLDFAGALLGPQAGQEKIFVPIETNFLGSQDLNIPVSDQMVIGLANIGPWEHYAEANEKAICLLLQIPGIKLIINSGYQLLQPGHKAAFDLTAKLFEECGFDQIIRYHFGKSDEKPLAMIAGIKEGARFALNPADSFEEDQEDDGIQRRWNLLHKTPNFVRPLMSHKDNPIQIRELWRIAMTDPQFHKETFYRYFVRTSVELEKQLLSQRSWASLGGPYYLAHQKSKIHQRPVISTSFIDQNHRTLYQDMDYGYILEVPAENIILTYHADAWAPYDMGLGWAKEELGKHSLLSPEELLGRTDPLRFNEVVVMGTHPDDPDKKVKISGIFVKADNLKPRVDDLLFQDLSDLAKNMNVPLVLLSETSRAARLGLNLDAGLSFDFKIDFQEKIKWFTGKNPQKSLAFKSSEEVKEFLPSWPVAGPKMRVVTADENWIRFLLSDSKNNSFAIILEKQGENVFLGHGKPQFGSTPGKDEEEKKKIRQILRPWFQNTLFPWLRERGFKNLKVDVVYEGAAEYFYALGFVRNDERLGEVSGSSPMVLSLNGARLAEDETGQLLDRLSGSLRSQRAEIKDNFLGQVEALAVALLDRFKMDGPEVYQKIFGDEPPSNVLSFWQAEVIDQKKSVPFSSERLGQILRQHSGFEGFLELFGKLMHLYYSFYDQKAHEDLKGPYRMRYYSQALDFIRAASHLCPSNVDWAINLAAALRHISKADSRYLDQEEKLLSELLKNKNLELSRVWKIKTELGYLRTRQAQNYLKISEAALKKGDLAKSNVFKEKTLWAASQAEAEFLDVISQHKRKKAEAGVFDTESFKIAPRTYAGPAVVGIIRFYVFQDSPFPALEQAARALDFADQALSVPDAPLDSKTHSQRIYQDALEKVSLAVQKTEEANFSFNELVLVEKNLTVLKRILEKNPNGGQTEQILIGLSKLQDRLEQYQGAVVQIKKEILSLTTSGDHFESMDSFYDSLERNLGRDESRFTHEQWASMKDFLKLDTVDLLMLHFFQNLKEGKDLYSDEIANQLTQKIRSTEFKWGQVHDRFKRKPVYEFLFGDKKLGRRPAKADRAVKRQADSYQGLYNNDFLESIVKTHNLRLMLEMEALFNAVISWTEISEPDLAEIFKEKKKGIISAIQKFNDTSLDAKEKPVREELVRIREGENGYLSRWQKLKDQLLLKAREIKEEIRSALEALGARREVVSDLIKEFGLESKKPDPHFLLVTRSEFDRQAVDLEDTLLEESHHYLSREVFENARTFCEEIETLLRNLENPKAQKRFKRIKELLGRARSYHQRIFSSGVKPGLFSQVAQDMESIENDLSLLFFDGYFDRKSGKIIYRLQNHLAILKVVYEAYSREEDFWNRYHDARNIFKKNRGLGTKESIEIEKQLDFQSLSRLTLLGPPADSIWSLNFRNELFLRLKKLDEEFLPLLERLEGLARRLESIKHDWALKQVESMRKIITALRSDWEIKVLPKEVYESPDWKKTFLKFESLWKEIDFEKPVEGTLSQNALEAKNLTQELEEIHFKHLAESIPAMKRELLNDPLLLKQFSSALHAVRVVGMAHYFSYPLGFFIEAADILGQNLGPEPARKFAQGFSQFLKTIDLNALPLELSELKKILGKRPLQASPEIYFYPILKALSTALSMVSIFYQGNQGTSIFMVEDLIFDLLDKSAELDFEQEKESIENGVLIFEPPHFLMERRLYQKVLERTKEFIRKALLLPDSFAPAPLPEIVRDEIRNSFKWMREAQDAQKNTRTSKPVFKTSRELFGRELMDLKSVTGVTVLTGADPEPGYTRLFSDESLDKIAQILGSPPLNLGFLFNYIAYSRLKMDSQSSLGATKITYHTNTLELFDKKTLFSDISLFDLDRDQLEERIQPEDPDYIMRLLDQKTLSKKTAKIDSITLKKLISKMRLEDIESDEELIRKIIQRQIFYYIGSDIYDVLWGKTDYGNFEAKSLSESWEEVAAGLSKETTLYADSILTFFLGDKELSDKESRHLFLRDIFSLSFYAYADPDPMYSTIFDEQLSEEAADFFDRVVDFLKKEEAMGPGAFTVSLRSKNGASPELLAFNHMLRSIKPFAKESSLSKSEISEMSKRALKKIAQSDGEFGNVAKNVLREMLQKGKIPDGARLTPILEFFLRVYDETGGTGEMVVGDRSFKVEFLEREKVLVITAQDGTQKPIVLENPRYQLRKLERNTAKLRLFRSELLEAGFEKETLDLEDFRLKRQEDARRVSDFFAAMTESTDPREALLELYLDASDEEARLSYFISELFLRRQKDAYFQVVAKGDPGKVGEFIDGARKFGVDRHLDSGFIHENESTIPENYKALSQRVSLITAGSSFVSQIPQGQKRLFLGEASGPNVATNLDPALRMGLEEARIELDPRSQSFRAWAQTAGNFFPVNRESFDLAELAGVLEGRILDTAGKYIFVPEFIESKLRAYRMMTKEVEQSL